MIEKRFEQLKAVPQIAPIFLKNERRIEAFFPFYFLALLVEVLIERELRLALEREIITELPLDPEQQDCERSATEQILRLFTLAEGRKLSQGEHTLQVFKAEFTDLEPQVLTLLGVSKLRFQRES